MSVTRRLLYTGPAYSQSAVLCGGSMDFPNKVEELLKLETVPVVAIDQESLFTFVNDAFVEEYGWERDELLGNSVTMIMPAHMHSGHNVGFSRFLTTETSELLGKRLPLKILYKDGRIETADHYIIGDKVNGSWRFAAAIDFPNKDADAQR